MCRFIAVGCVPLSGSSSLAYPFLFSPIMYPFPSYYGARAASLKSPGGWVSCAFGSLWHGGLSLIHMNKLQFALESACAKSAYAVHV